MASRSELNFVKLHFVLFFIASLGWTSVFAQDTPATSTPADPNTTDSDVTAPTTTKPYKGAPPDPKLVPPTETQRWTYSREDGVLAFVPYGPNIIHVTFAKGPDRIVDPGWGFIANPSGEGAWTVHSEEESSQLSSAQMSIDVSSNHAQFNVTGADGTVLFQYKGGTFAPATVNGESTNTVTGTFSATDDEHYFGLGQHQDGYLDMSGKTVRVAHDYNAPMGQTVGVPFLVTNRGYGIIWDNPSITTVKCGIEGETTWNSEVGESISFFIIVGKTTDDIYSGYRLLTGVTHLLPKAVMGYIQSKARYASQKELLDIAHGYRDRKYPCDVLVVDWFHWKNLGDLDLDRGPWPDPAAMTSQLHDLGFHVMITVWPRFTPASTHYDELVQKDFLLKTTADGKVAVRQDFGACIDSTNLAARKWLWDTVNASYRAEGFDYWWTDETEPDIGWHDMTTYAGSGSRIFNIFPLLHTGALYDGQRSCSQERVAILARDAYLGAQRNGTTFWSSDISPNWSVYHRQISTGLNMCATGLPYWSCDIGGWQDMSKIKSKPATLLLDPSDARKLVRDYDDYPELYTRWFQFAAFCPTFRAHGQRDADEVWSYGKQAEPILVKYLNLRYQLLPYIYSQAYQSYKTGAPFMRALFMDFGSDPQVYSIKDEYMFGPAFLVAPVTEQGATSRDVYLPAGTDWYNYWTNELIKGGQTVNVQAPIDTLPLFVRAGSIIPIGKDIQNTEEDQPLTELRVYSGSDGSFDLYSDDGHTYDYESGKFTLNTIKWNNAKKIISFSVQNPFTGPATNWIKVIP